MKRRLMVIILSLTLIFTLIPMTAFAAGETVTVTLKATTIDGKTPVSDYTLQIPKGEYIHKYFADNKGEFDKVSGYFKTSSYICYTWNSGDIFLSSLPATSYTFRGKSQKFMYEKINEDTVLYVPMQKIIKTVNLKVEAPVCGEKVKLIETDSYESILKIPDNMPQVTAVTDGINIQEDSFWFKYMEGVALESLQTPDNLFEGTFKGDKTYGYAAIVSVEPAYVFSPEIKASDANAKVFLSPDIKEIAYFYGSVKAVHDWDEGVVTTKPTVDKEGVKTYTCKGGCGETKTESIPKLGSDPTEMGSDGTAVGEGASAAAADQKITGMKTDTDPKGSKFNKLRLRSTYQTKTSITLKWKSNKKAEKYVIYGNRCGTSTKIRKSVKLYTVKKSTKTTMTKVIKKVKGAKLKKNTYYKFLVVALNKNNKVVSTSRMIHVATKGGKYTNYKSISVKKDKITKAKNLKKGKSLKLEPTQVKASKSLKARKHVAIRYESTNKSIAKVTSKGVIKALKKGTCYVYIYAQNGVYKRIKVVVK